MATYTHDLTFAALKNTKEQVSGNYTTSQYLKTLDHFLWLALGAVINTCPNLFLNYVAKVVAQQATRPVKMTSDDKHALPVSFMNLLLTKDRVPAAKELHLNRGILFAFLNVFVNLTEEYRRLHETPPSMDPLEMSQRYLTVRRIENDLEMKRGGNLYGATLEARHWLQEASAFKNVIVEKYIRLALNGAQKTYVSAKHKRKLGEIINVFMITLYKAIDRCDSRHGVLTTFITNWLRGARSKVLDEIFAESAETSYDQQVEDHGEEVFAQHSTQANRDMEAMQSLAAIAKRVDPRGCVRASLGISEHVSTKHIRLLEILKAHD